MYTRAPLACLTATAVMAASAKAQNVQFRIVERTSQQVISAADSLLELAVQAKVTGGMNLGGFSFNIISNEAETNGTLQRAKIMNGSSPNTYFTGSPWTANSTTGVGGIAGQFSYLAGISASFNGVINANTGTWTQNPGAQDIGLIAGAVTGNALTNTPGIDNDADGIPDLAPSNGTGASANNEVAPLEPSAAGPYFANNQFVDVYRFRYSVTNLVNRSFFFTLSDVGAQVFSQLLYNNGAWGAQNITVAQGSISVQDFHIDSPAPGACLPMAAAGLWTLRRRPRTR